MRSCLIVLCVSMLILSGCGEEPARLSEQDIDRIADRAAQKVLDRLENRLPSPAGVAALKDARPTPPLHNHVEPAVGSVVAAVPPPAKPAASASPASPNDPLVLQIGPKVWTRSAVLRSAQIRNLSLDASTGPTYFGELVNYQLAALKAQEEGMDKQPEYLRRAQTVVDEFAAHALYRDRITQMQPLDEAKVRAHYDQTLELYTDRERAEVEEYFCTMAPDLEKVRSSVRADQSFEIAKSKGLIPDLVRCSGKTTARPGQYPVEIFASLRTMKPGAFTKPTPAENGFAMIRLIDYHPESVTPFDTVKRKLRNQLEQERLQQALREVDTEARKFVSPVQTFPDRIPSTDSLAVLAQVGTRQIRRQDLLHELAALPDAVRARFQSTKGFAELLDRVMQKILFSQYAFSHHPTFMQQNGPLLEDLKNQELVKVYMEQVLAPRMEIAPGDVEKYYAAHKAEWDGLQVHLRNISFRIGAKNEGSVQALDQAAKAIARLKAGEAFDKVAKDLSEDVSTRPRGGDMGWLYPDQLLAPLKAEVERMSPGSNSLAPVVTARGFHIIRLEGRRGAKPLEEVREDILKVMRAQRQQKVMDEVVASWKGRYRIETHPEAFSWPAARPPASPSPEPAPLPLVTGKAKSADALPGKR